jgi:hypothetical protein
MEHEAWPTPQTPAREPLPRVEDLPVAEQGYEQESVKAAFDSFYRHAAQLDAALRTLEAVDSFHRQAASLRADLRALRASGWTQQSWTQPPSYGYDLRAPREGIPPAVWRVGGEVAFLVAVAVGLGVAKLSWWVIVLAMAGAFAIVCIIEWLAGREPITYPRASAPVHPVVEAERADDTDEHDSLGWTAFEEAQEPSDAMTIIGAPQAGEEPGPEVPPSEEPEPEPEEPELPPAAEAEPEQPEPRRRWRRKAEEAEAPATPAEPPRHVRVLPADENREPADPWEQGFDAPDAPEESQAGEAEEEQTQDRLVVEGQGRRRFRRR